LATHPDKGKKMGKDGKEYITKHYLREKVFEKWDRIISLAGPSAS